MSAAILILGCLCMSIVYFSADHKMPPVPEISHNVLYDILKDENIFDKNGAALPQHDPIWKILCKKNGLNMQPKSLHLHTYKDCVKKCRSRMSEYKNIRIRKTKKKKICKDEEDYHVYYIANPHNKSPLKFNVKFTEEEWLKIRPIMTKRKKKLQVGWTDIFYNKIWIAQGLKCAYNFKTLSVTGTIDNLDDLQILFNAKCTDCGTGMNGMLLKVQNEEQDFVGFQIDTFSVQDIDHTLKRNFAHQDRKEGKKILANKYAADYREGVQKERKQGRSKEPAHLHDSDIYQDARQEARDEEIGYKNSFTLFSPYVIKTCGIRKISLDPFYVFYWTDEQVEFWKKVHKLKLPVSLDATGGLVRKTIAVNMICKRTILYYTLVIGLDDKIVPLMQFVSSIHHVAIIEEALNTWIEKSGAPVPGNISTDGSSALQHATCKSFNKISFKENNLQCYEYLINERQKLPPCYYKSDLAHLLRTLNYWPCFHGTKEKTSLLFYKRCVAYISLVTCIEDFKKAAVGLFAISMCDKYVEGSQVHDYLISFSDAIKTHVFSEKNATQQADIVESKIARDELPIKTENSLTQFVDKIIDDARKASESALVPLLKDEKGKISQSNVIIGQEKELKVKVLSKNINTYVCKGFEKNFKSLCQKFPSWTNVLAKAYGYEGDELNSAGSEAHFKNRKSQIPRPLSIIRFLLHNAQHIEAAATRDYPLFKKLPKSTRSETLSEKNLFELPESE